MDLTRFSPCCCSCRCSGCGVLPCGHAADVRRSARFPPRTDSVTGGYRRLTHLLRVTAHAHDVPVVPLWLTDCVCRCPIGRRRDYLRERRAACACGTRLTEAYRGHVRGRRVVLHEYITCLGYIAPSLPHTCPETPETPPCKGSASSANKISLGKYENSVCHVASTVAVKIDYR